MLLEPIGRNTAPAAAVAAMTATRDGDDPILLVLPADHIIGDVERFHAAVETGRSAAADGYLVTFGIVPESPHTGYGYIHKGDALAGLPAFTVERFVEKPDLQTATEYVASGNYLWNSGMFMFLASRYLEELEKFDPQHGERLSTSHSMSVRKSKMESGSTGPPSRPSKATRSTTRSWSTRIGPLLSPSMPVGATSGRGRLSGRSAIRITTAT